MIIKIKHRLSKIEALDRIKTLLENIKIEYISEFEDLHEQWDSDKGMFNLKIKGYKVSGTVQSKDSLIELNLNLPLVAILFAEKIKGHITIRLLTNLK